MGVSALSGLFLKSNPCIGILYFNNKTELT